MIILGWVLIWYLVIKVLSFVWMMFCVLLFACFVMGFVNFFKKDLYFILGDPQSWHQIWHGGDYRNISPFTTKNYSYFEVVVTPISVYVTDSSEHLATYDTYVKVNDNATMFITDLSWVTRDMIVILFTLKNSNILSVKRRKQNDYLFSWFFVWWSDCNWQFGIYRSRFSVFEWIIRLS